MTQPADMPDAAHRRARLPVREDVSRIGSSVRCYYDHPVVAA
ncbi:MAG: hypothetical protein ACRDNP_03165 [Gaiellaceae bacterium]